MSINHRRISLSIAANLLLEVINKISPLLILHHAQKTLGLASFGWAQYQMALFESLQPFITYGFANYALAEVRDNEPIKMRLLLSHLLTLKTVNALLVLAFFMIEKGSMTDPFVLGLLAIVVSSCVFDSFWVCIAYHKLVPVSLATGILRLISLALILALVRAPEDKNIFVLFSILPNALIAFSTGFYAFFRLSLVKVAWSQLQLILRKATPFALVILFATLLDRLDIFLAEHWFGIEAAGVYSGPAKVVQSLTMIIASIALPFFAETRKIEDSESLYKHVVLSLWCLGVLIAPVIFGLPFVEKDIADILFPKQPDSALGILSTLSISIIGSVFLSVFGVQLLLAKGSPWSVLIGCLMGVLIVPVGSWMLKSELGLHGIAVSMIIGKLLMGGFCVYRGRVFLPKLPWKPLFKPLLAGACMGLVLKFLDLDSFLINLAAGGAVYVFCLLVGSWDEFVDVVARFKERRRS